jgi:hypothetical protein
LINIVELSNFRLNQGSSLFASASKVTLPFLLGL